MQARYYDPVIGRFYSNDPVGYTAKNPVMSFNRYMYANNNPYKYTDPDGKFIWHVVGAVVAGGINAVAQGVSKGFDNIDYSQVGVAAAKINKDTHRYFLNLKPRKGLYLWLLLEPKR